MPPFILRYVDVQRDRHGRPLYYFRHRGTRQRIEGNPSEPAFMARYAELLAQVSGDTAPKPSAPRQGTMAALASDYRASPEFARLTAKSQEYYRLQLDRLQCLSQFRVADIGRAELLAIRDRIASERGTRTADQFIQVARSMFSFAVNREIVSHNPLARVARVNEGTSYAPWKDADCTAFEASNPPRWALTAYMLARYAAPRRGDVLRLTRANFDGTALRFTPSKTRRSTGRQLVIRCHARLKEHLDALPVDVGLLVPSPNGKPWEAGSFSKAMRAVLDGAGLTTLHFHGLRHTCATTLAELGASEHEIAAVTGHDDPAMVKRYTRKASQTALADAAIRRMEGGK